MNRDEREILRLRTEVSKLIAECFGRTRERDEVMRRLDAIRELHTPVVVEYFDGDSMQACKTCGAHFEYPVAYPCTTTRVARGDFA